MGVFSLLKRRWVQEALRERDELRREAEDCRKAAAIDRAEAWLPLRFKDVGHKMFIWTII